MAAPRRCAKAELLEGRLGLIKVADANNGMVDSGDICRHGPVLPDLIVNEQDIACTFLTKPQERSVFQKRKIECRKSPLV
jgi:hypothetical protein